MTILKLSDYEVELLDAGLVHLDRQDYNDLHNCDPDDVEPMKLELKSISTLREKLTAHRKPLI